MKIFINKLSSTPIRSTSISLQVRKYYVCGLFYCILKMLLQIDYCTLFMTILIFT